MRVEILSSADQLADAGTDAFCPEPMHTSSYLKVLESLPHIGRREARHLVAYDDGQPLAYLPCYLQHTSLHDDLRTVLLTAGERRLATRAVRAGLFPRLSPALVCSSPESFYCELIHRPGIDPPGIRQIASSLTDALIETGRREGVDLVGFMNLRRRDEMLWGHLLGRNYLFSPRTASAYLPLPWDDFEAYFRSLSRSRRKSMRSDWSRMNRTGMRVHEVLDIQRIADVLERIIDEMWRTRGRRCPFNRDYYSLVQRHMGANSKVLVGAIEGKIQGFTLLLRTAREMCAYQYGGLPEPITRDSALYFNLCFRETIKDGIDSGVREIRYGPATLRPKITRGCVTEDLGIFLRCLHRRHLPVMKAVMTRNRKRRSSPTDGNP